jgi:hypothetical protein
MKYRRKLREGSGKCTMGRFNYGNSKIKYFTWNNCWKKNTDNISYSFLKKKILNSFHSLQMRNSLTRNKTKKNQRKI